MVYRRCGRVSVELLPAVSAVSLKGGRSSAHLDEIVGGAVEFGEGPDKASSSGTDSIVDSS